MTLFLALWTFWFMFTLSYSPFSMALSLTLTALGVCLWAWMSVNKWAAITVALIYIGGMMIVILYVCSLKNEAKVTPLKTKFYLLTAIPSLILFTLALTSPNMTSYTSSNPMLQLFQTMNSSALAFLAIYLILVLFVLMETLESFKGALIKKF